MKKILSAILMVLMLSCSLSFGQDYSNYNPTADKILQPDGSIVSIISGTTWAPANAARATQYKTMPVSAAKYLMPDGSIVNGVPITTTITGTVTDGYCIKVNSSGGLVYGSCVSAVTDPLTVGHGGTGVSVSGATTAIAVGGGTTSPIVWTAATGTGAPVRAGSPVLTAGAMLGGVTAVGTNGTNTIALGVGVAPSTSATPTSAAQLWVQDTGAVADNASWHMRNEYGSTGPVGFAVPPERALATSNAITLGIPDVTGKMLNNYGQTALNDNITYTLPAAAANYAFTFISGVTIAKFVRFEPGVANTDIIYLDGVGGLAGKYIGVASVVIGNAITCRTFQATGPVYDWYCSTISGAWLGE